MNIEIKKIRSKSYKTYSYTNNGNIILHREDGPALTTNHPNGSISREEYYLHGELHRLDGPAIITYSKGGKIGYELYCIKGTPYTKEDYYKYPQVIEFIENKKFYETIEEILDE